MAEPAAELDLTRAADPAPDRASSSVLVHLGLFLACCVTTWWFGGVAFAATLMGILACHEAGHFIAARRHGIDASLPYFIPLPPGISLGTLGAVIRMRAPIADRNQLLDVGAAGPLAGVAVALPLLIIGLAISPVGPPEPDSMIEGNSLLYILLKLIVLGRYLPADGVDVNLHPMAFAAWVGLLITFINLIPIGQLDGGHVACAVLGPRHERFSAVLHRGLLAIGVLGAAGLAALAVGDGASVGDAVGYGASGALPWLLWAVLLFLMRRMGGGR